MTNSMNEFVSIASNWPAEVCTTTAFASIAEYKTSAPLSRINQIFISADRQ